MSIKIEYLSISDAGAVFDIVRRLLKELGEEEDDLGSLNEAGVLEAWTGMSDRVFTVAARSEDGTIIGLATVVEAFAIYANGSYGIVNEMYVDPGFRSKGVGHQLLASIEALAKKRGWSRIDVTAPESDGWERTRAFYEREGFRFTGPKLKLLLKHP